MEMNHIKWSVHAALTSWQAGPFALATVAVLIGVAYWYLRADWQLATRGRRWPRSRVACFMAGLVAVDLAIQSPVATFTATYFEAHVIQHLLLMVVAPPLLALGAPSTLLLQTSSRRVKSLWLGVLRSRPFALLTFPVVVWAAYFGLMFGFFMSSLINTSMEHMWLMDIMNVLFLFGATLYWWPMVGLDPIVHWRMGYGARMVNILLGGPPEVILGLAILSSHRPIASMYSLSSTHAGGGLLWVSTEAATLIGFIPIFWQWINADERAARRADATADKELAAALATSPAAAGEDADLADLLAPAAASATAQADGDTPWEAYWRMRTGRVPGRTAWTPNRPPGRG
ncbi:MAG TPA: cytochrome c oxidase assembly protein [Acidimicrobiales bacterium]|nr:cytochrome c oxidase assembly protein [Acidimicrobiales bacterium]